VANIIKHKRTAVAAHTPATTDLVLGELAINVTDGRLFLKRSVGGVESIVEIATGLNANSLILSNDNTGLVFAVLSSVGRLMLLAQDAGFIQFNCGVHTAFRQVSASTTLLITDHVIEVISGSPTLYLPSSAGLNGKEYRIKSSTSGVVTVVPVGTEKIDGQSTLTLNQYNSVDLQSNNANWVVF
jgi:hypothetical protein